MFSLFYLELGSKNMINVKISLPGADSNSSFDNFIDPNSEDLKNIKFHINNDVEEADFWFVFEDLYKQKEECLINREKIIYLNTETHIKFLFSKYTFKKILKPVL